LISSTSGPDLCPAPITSSLSSFHSSAPHRALHSSPTRRSSDLGCSPSAAPPAPPRRSSTTSPPSPTTPPSTNCMPPSSPWPCARSEEHTSELQSRVDLVCRLLLEKKKRHATEPNRPGGAAIAHEREIDAVGGHRIAIGRSGVRVTHHRVRPAALVLRQRSA